MENNKLIEVKQSYMQNMVKSSFEHLKELKEYISHKEFKAVQEQIKALSKTRLTDIAYQAMYELYVIITRKESLLRQLKRLKSDLTFDRKMRWYKKQYGFNNACRLLVLARDAFKNGLMNFENYSYLWNNLKADAPGLNSDFIDSLNATYLSKLLETNPLYSNIEKAEKRIKSMLVNLEFNKPFIP